jgi:hypothetical protein
MTQNRIPYGELCLLTLDAPCQGLRSTADKATATNGSGIMSRRLELLPEDEPIAARFEDLLELRSLAATRGYRDLEDLYAKRILADAFGLNGPGGHAA